MVTFARFVFGNMHKNTLLILWGKCIDKHMTVWYNIGSKRNSDHLKSPGR